MPKEHFRYNLIKDFDKIRGAAITIIASDNPQPGFKTSWKTARQTGSASETLVNLAEESEKMKYFSALVVLVLASVMVQAQPVEMSEAEAYLQGIVDDYFKGIVDDIKLDQIREKLSQMSFEEHEKLLEAWANLDIPDDLSFRVKC